MKRLLLVALVLSAGLRAQTQPHPLCDLLPPNYSWEETGRVTRIGDARELTAPRAPLCPGLASVCVAGVGRTGRTGEQMAEASILVQITQYATPEAADFRLRHPLEGTIVAPNSSGYGDETYIRQDSGERGFRDIDFTRAHYFARVTAYGKYSVAAAGIAGYIDQGLSRLPQTCTAPDDKPAPAEVIVPANGSTLQSKALTFTWSAGAAIQDYRILIGTSPGGGDLVNTGFVQSRSAGATLPDRPGKIYVTLWSRPKDGSQPIAKSTVYDWIGPSAIDLGRP